MSMKGKIAEVFESIQGEGIYCGQRQVFVRFFGCNLDSCRYCDTKPFRFNEYTAQELLDMITSYKGEYHSVSFTGGEPLAQKEFLREILILTRAKGLKNYLETNGTLPEALSEVIGCVDIVAMDIKLPSSTGLRPLWDEHRRFLRTASAKDVFLKAVVNSSTGQEDLRTAIKIIREVNPASVLVLQPDSSDDHPELGKKIDNFKEICVSEGIIVCVIPQLHKVMGIK